MNARMRRPAARIWPMGRAGIDLGWVERETFLRSGIGPIKGDSYLYSLVTRWWPGGPVGGTPKKSTNPSAPSKTSVFFFQHCFSNVLFFESQNHECKFLLSAVHMCLQTPTRASRAGIPPGGGGFRSGSLGWGRFRVGFPRGGGGFGSGSLVHAPPRARKFANFR